MVMDDRSLPCCRNADELPADHAEDCPVHRRCRRCGGTLLDPEHEGLCECTVIKTGGAMYRAERSRLGVPGGLESEPSPLVTKIAEEVLGGKTRSYVNAASDLARYVLGKF
jgi:hypothetical protein